MAMRETEGSLRAYFLLAGGYSVLRALFELHRFYPLVMGSPRLAIGTLAPLVAHIVLGLGFVVAGLRLKERLLTDIRWIQRMLVIAGVALIAEVALVWWMFHGTPLRYLNALVTGTAIYAGVGLLITWYLHRNITRLSREARARVPSVFE